VLPESAIVVPISGDSPAPSGGAGAPKGGRGARSSVKKEDRPIDWGRFNDLMQNFVLIYGTDTVFDERARLILKVNALRLAFGSDVVKMWLNSDQRRMVMQEQMVFDPTGTCEPPCINLFDGFGMSPKAGDCEPILELLYHLCADSADTPDGVGKVVAWCLNWLALPLQKPGTKMRSALVFHGPQGAGKNLFFEIMTKLYGRYGLVVGQDQLEDKFNDWASQKLFMIGDEVVARAELYHHKNKLKAFITGDTIQINAKMLPLRQEANHVNVVFLSNELQPLALEQSDRRYFVVYTPPRRKDDLYARVAACLEGGGAEAFFHYLKGLDLSGFSSFDIPPMTRAKADLIELGLKPSERFLREWVRGYLPLPLNVCSAEQLIRAFRRWCSMTGERFPPPQAVFSGGLQKCAGDLLRYKVCKLNGFGFDKKAVRMWLPVGCECPEGMSEGEWAAQAATEFERALGSFMGAGADVAA